MRLKVATDSVAFGSNINDVVVPAEMRKKFLSGLDFFDVAIGGMGFTPSASMIFTGEAGAGKTTMMLTLADHLTRSGTVAVFNTAEESLFQVKAVCERLGLKKGFAVGNETNVSDLLKKADKLRLMPVNKDKPFLLIIDSLQCMDDGHFSTGRITCQTAERSLEQVTSWCKENYTNAIVIGQVTKSGNFAGSVAKWAIWTTAIMAALTQLGIATDLLQTLFTGVVIGLSLAFGLAFGLGGKDAAARIIEKVRSDIAHHEL